MRAARRFQCDSLCFDPGVERRKRLEFSGQVLDPAPALALQVPVVGEQALPVGHAILRQQQLQRRVLAQLVGGAQQRGKRFALAPETLVQGVAARMQVLQGVGLGHDLTLEGRQFTRGRTDLFVGIAQCADRRAALAFQLAALRGDRLELGTGALEPPLGVVGILRRGRPRGAEHQRARQQRGGTGVAHQPVPSSRLRPLIASGRGRPSRSSTVGAMSRSAPPLRSFAGRLPT